MAEEKKTRNPLIALEDWWTVWFGLIILLVGTVLGILAYSGTMDKVSVPKLGKWVSSPADIFYKAKKTTIDVKEETTLAGMVEAINAKKPKATVEIVPAEGGVQLKVTSSREEPISFKALMMGGEKLEFTKDGVDPGGLGAMTYLSQVLPDESVNVGLGKITVTAQRNNSIFFAMLLSLGLVGILTALGVSVMGSSPAKYLLGFVAVVLLAIVSYFLANQATIKAYGLGYAFWALLIGLLISNTIGTPEWLKSGVRTEMYIKTGLVLLGAEILFGKILSLGPPGLLVAWVVTPSVVIFMYWFGCKVIKMKSRPLVMIIAAATSVCGVSAAIAAAGATRAKKEDLTLAVGMTLIFTVLMMIFMPMFIHFVGMSDVVGAAWMGGTIDSTGAVVAAGAFLGPRAETVAAVVKMVQNVLIGVLGFFVAVYWVTSVERDPNGARPNVMEIWIRFPKFIVGFVAASVIFSFVLSPLFGQLFNDGGSGLKLVEKGVIKAVTNPLRGWFFCLAFVAIGLESNFKELAKQMEGGKPLLLYVIGQSFNLILTLVMAYLAFVVFFPNAVS